MASPTFFTACHRPFNMLRRRQLFALSGVFAGMPFFRRAAIVLLCACLSLRPALADLPELGDPTLDSFSSEEEQQLGLAFYRSLRANLAFIDDLLINDYLNTLGQRLASHSDAAGKHFTFFMIKAPTINAFAGPAGYIGVHSKLFLTAKNESQLASVLAHETAHVSQRHLARQFDSSGKSAALTLAALVAAILVGSQDPQAGQAILLGGIAGSQQSSINFTRQNEYEADRVGIGILTRSGINPEGMVEFFETLLAQGPDNGMEYLRTHPLNATRVSEARGRIQPAMRKLPRDSLDFQLAHARLEVLTSRPLRKLLRLPATSLAERYRKALALIWADQGRAAIPILQSLIREHRHPWFRLALAEAYSRLRDDEKALATLKALNDLYPGHLPVTIAYARVLLLDRQPLQVISLIRKQLQRADRLGNQDRANLYNLLARAYFANGQTAAALEATGNQYVYQGYLELAIQQFDNALSQPDLSPSTRERLQSEKAEIKKAIGHQNDDG